MARRLVTGGEYAPTIAVTRESKDRLAEWIEKNNRPQQQIILAKLIDWFVAQPPAVQQVIIGTAPGEMKGAYADALRAIADQIAPASLRYDDRGTNGKDDRRPPAGGRPKS